MHRPDTTRIVDDAKELAGRHGLHLAAGVALAAGAIALSRMMARGAPAAEGEPVIPAATAGRRPPFAFAMVWPPLFMALTLSGLRIWNAPPSQARSRALTLWGLSEAFSALWMALGPRRLGGRTTAAVASVGAAAAYAWEARKVEAPSSAAVAPYVGWTGLAGVLSEQLWKRRPASASVH